MLQFTKKRKMWLVQFFSKNELSEMNNSLFAVAWTSGCFHFYSNQAKWHLNIAFVRTSFCCTFRFAQFPKQSTMNDNNRKHEAKNARNETKWMRYASIFFFIYHLYLCIGRTQLLTHKLLKTPSTTKYCRDQMYARRLCACVCAFVSHINYIRCDSQQKQ